MRSHGIWRRFTALFWMARGDESGLRLTLRRSRAARLALLSVLCCLPSSFAPAKTIGSVGAWNIFLIEADARYCGMNAEYKGGSELFVRVREDTLLVTVSVYNNRWRSIKNRKNYQLSAMFSGQAKASFKTDSAYGENENSNVGLHFTADGDFLLNFKRKKAVTFYLRGGRELTTLSLKDTSKGLVSVGKCVAQHFGGPARDPFRELEKDSQPGDPSASSVSDPFQDI